MQIYTWHEDVFSSWSPEMAYWLGMLAADGCVYRRQGQYVTSLGLKLSDGYHVESFARFVSVDAHPRIVPRGEGGYENGEDKFNLAITNKKITLAVQALGLDPRKSLTLPWPTDYPHEYMSAYVRGFFDGDGSVFSIKHPSAKRDYIGVNFIGPLGYIEGLHAFLNKFVVHRDYGHIRSLPISDGFYHQFVYSGDHTIQKLTDWMYAGSNEQTRLARKYEHVTAHYAFLAQNGIEITKQREDFLFNPKSTEKWIVDFDGEEMSLTEAATRSVVSRQTLYHRIVKMGMDPMEAITTPPIDGLAKANQAFRENPPSAENGKVANNSTINWEIAAQMRTRYMTGATVATIAQEFDQGTALVSDVVLNRSWHDETYKPEKRQSQQITLTVGDRTGTIREWEDWSGVPYNTIDRRLREGKTPEQAVDPNRAKPAPYKRKKEEGRAGLTAAKVREIRQGYKDGLRGQAAYDHWGITKSAYIDITGNRTWKETVVWWRDAAAASSPSV